ncbi:uncharacterized protein LOC111108075 isoform X2 [Crassostrea virginica]
MIIRTMNNGLIAILLVNLWGSAHSGYWDKYTDSGSVFCSYNYFFDGKLCKECHRGSYGINCSSLCQPSTYGKFCSEKCNCWNSACHYLNIIGCNDPLTSECVRGHYFVREDQRLSLLYERGPGVITAVRERTRGNHYCMREDQRNYCCMREDQRYHCCMREDQG